MQISVEHLQGDELLWAVASALGKEPSSSFLWARGVFVPTKDVSYKAPFRFGYANALALAEKEGISLLCLKDDPFVVLGRRIEPWWACYGDATDDDTLGHSGATPVEAILRCFVEETLGESVEVPPELIKTPSEQSV